MNTHLQGDVEMVRASYRKTLSVVQQINTVSITYLCGIQINSVKMIFCVNSTKPVIKQIKHNINIRKKPKKVKKSPMSL